MVAVAVLGHGCEVYLGGSAEACGGDDCHATDRRPPDRPAALSAEPLGRSAIEVSWNASADGASSTAVSYELHIASEPGADESKGRVIVRASRRAPGERERAMVEGVRPGEPTYVSVIAVDRAGNRSPAARVGPVVTDFVLSGARFSPHADAGDNALGYRFASGHFDGDAYEDLAVAAPFRRVGDLPGAGAVYLYFGTSEGIADRPDVVIEGTEALAQLGNGLAGLDWDGDGHDDLAIGAPFAADGDGAVYIFRGESMLALAPVLQDAAADWRVSVGGGWFAGGSLGFTLAAARFDADDRDDLAVSSVTGGGGEGGVAIVYGGTGSGDATLGAADPGAAVDLLRDPQRGDAHFGIALINAGKTAGPDDRGDDLAIAGFQQKRAYLIRGRAKRPDSGLRELRFDPQIDLEVTSESADADAYFAATLSSLQRRDGRDLVVGSYLEGTDDAGQAVLIAGRAVGRRQVAEVATLILDGAPGGRFGSALPDRGGDVDGDGLEDLVVTGGYGSVELFVWYGGDLPEGVASADGAAYTVVAPSMMAAETPGIGGTPMNAAWVGDVDGDGLDELAWADWSGNDRDGVFELLR